MTNQTDKLIELVNVTAGYGKNIVLRNVNLSINANDFIGVIGPNGGGKTTLIKLIIGQLKPFAGEVIYHAKGTGSLIGYLPQANQIDKNFPVSVKEVVLSGLLEKKELLVGYSREQKSLALNLMKQVGIDHLQSKSIGQLSGGQLQRALLCRALISEPQILILDEPNTYVDSSFEGELYEMLRRLNQQMAIVMVSHDLGTITSYVKTIACVNGSLFYHQSNQITNEQLAAYNCPIQIIAHGPVPHTVLLDHSKENHHNHQH